jgi:hypothetical protein
MLPMVRGTSRTRSDAASHDEAGEAYRQSLTTSAQGSLNSSSSDDNVLTVDWDGPDDPENPKKYA